MKELFSTHSDKIKRVLPILFKMADLECSRGGKLGMEIGNMREKILIALYIHVFGKECVSLPSTTKPETDIYVKDTPISIKTKTGPGYSGVKLSWTVDRIKAEEFCRTYFPTSNILFVRIERGKPGDFCYIPLEVQLDVLKEKGVNAYLKKPKEGTNPRGVEISAACLKFLKEHKKTHCLVIDWTSDRIPGEEDPLYKYEHWLKLWRNL